MSRKTWASIVLAVVYAHVLVGALAYAIRAHALLVELGEPVSGSVVACYVIGAVLLVVPLVMLSPERAVAIASPQQEVVQLSRLPIEGDYLRSPSAGNLLVIDCVGDRCTVRTKAGEQYAIDFRISQSGWTVERGKGFA